MSNKANVTSIPAPLFRDPIYDGPTDPTIIWNREEECYFMFYTQRRSFGVQVGVSSVHGTKIGIASSKDGMKWLYRGTLDNLDIEPGHNTFWAPEIIWAEGKYHMYVSYITGIPVDWDYERHILHYTADDLWNWNFESILELSSDRAIDACVHQIAPDTYKMWYKDEAHNSHTFSAVSHDLYHWEVVGEEINDCPQEGPNVFEFQGKKWLISDCWKGLAVYHSEDFSHWTRQKNNILVKPGKRPFDNVLGNHPDILVINDEAYIFYFTHPAIEGEERGGLGGLTLDMARTVMQAARLSVENGELVCNRDEDFVFNF